MKYLLILIALSTVACQRTRYVVGEDGKTSLIETSRIHGGVLISSGLDQNNDGILDNDEIDRMSTVYDGTNGQDGLPGDPGVDAQSPIFDVIDPCGDGKGVDEVLLVTDFGIMAWYKNLGLALLSDGDYKTTDKQKCYFSIVNGEVVL